MNPSLPITVRCMPVTYQGLPAVAMGPQNGNGHLLVRTIMGTEHSIHFLELEIGTSDPVGFGYVLQWYNDQPGDGTWLHALEEAWWSGKITDADRQALFNVVQEVGR